MATVQWKLCSLQFHLAWSSSRGHSARRLSNRSLALQASLLTFAIGTKRTSPLFSDKLSRLALSSTSRRRLCVRRRDFIKAIAASAAVWPLAAHAQKPVKTPLIGVLWPNPPSQFEPIRQGLKDLGYIEGKNIRFEFRWAEGAVDKLPEMALDLVHIPVDLCHHQPLWRPSAPREQSPSSSLPWAIRW